MIILKGIITTTLNGKPYYNLNSNMIILKGNGKTYYKANITVFKFQYDNT